MQKFIICLLVVMFSISANASSSLFGNWKGTLIKANAGYSCSPSDLAIATDGSHLFIKLTDGCSMSAMTKVFAIKGNRLYLGSQNVGTISSDKISIVRNPGQFGGSTFSLHVQMNNTELHYSESVEGSSHDYAIAGQFSLLE